MAQTPSVSELNLKNNEQKTVDNTVRLRHKKCKKKKSGAKRKKNLYFKRKKLIRSLKLKEKLLGMSDNQDSPAFPKTDKVWQHQDEIAFWKARATSLEYENKMLHNHIRNMYIKTISEKKQIATGEELTVEDEGGGEQFTGEYYEEEAQQYDEVDEENYELGEENYEEVEEENSEITKYENKKKNRRDKGKSKAMKQEDNEDEEESKPPEVQLSKVREEEMKILYGSAWRKIIGMETAVQLNYDLTLEKFKPKHWPVIPIKL